MIRDPSDGSVKPAPPPNGSLPSGESGPPVTATAGGAGPKSGLPPVESDQLAKLQRSREWLKTYRTNPEAVMRKMGETE